ncbi:MAG: hypothetical protein JXX14_11170 [Deltaproteobacteria bacterium]|nr:hypothetical protein [Deltaproteobacteria bacterium]
MTEKAFDAAGFVQFDLASGTIENPIHERLALIPFELFTAIPATDALKQAAHAWGKSRGRVFKVMEGSGALTMTVLAQHLQGEIAMMGAGSAGIEVWGDALLVRIEGKMATSKAVAKVIEGFTAGYFSAIASEPFDGISDSPDDAHLIVFLGNPEAIIAIRKHMMNDVPLLDAVTQLIKEVA